MKILITGASSGIGRDMARYLASDTNNELILVAKDKTKLKAIQKEIPSAKIISCDLANEEEVKTLYQRCRKEQIDFLINNAGFGLFGFFHQTDLNRELEMIDVNVKAMHILTKLFLQDFVKKDAGRILNVCSSAGFMAGPKLSTYYATKNYITKLTMAINEELRHLKSKVWVGALCPGPVNTNFNRVAHGKFTIDGISSKYVARYAIKKAMQNKMLIVPTLGMKIGLFLLRLMPYRLQLKIAYQIQSRKM